MKLPIKLRALLSRWSTASVGKLDVRRQQYVMLGGLLAALVFVLWFVMWLSGAGEEPRRSTRHKPAVTITENTGVTPSRIDPALEWIGTAGADLAKLKSSDEQRIKDTVDLKDATSALTRRISELEKKVPPVQPPPAPALSDQPSSSVVADAAEVATPDSSGAESRTSQAYPPGAPPIGKSGARKHALKDPSDESNGPMITRVSLSSGTAEATTERSKPGDRSGKPRDDDKLHGRSTENFLPVSFTRGRLLGGIDAPTGGQAQNNPLPVIIQLTDNAILPNQYRSDTKECFIVASAWGDISSERAYMRTSNLSCVRNDNSVLEVSIEGNIYGEDGKLGMRGRLVTKQGQLLANALRAGIVSGIGHGFAQGGSTVTTSPFGSLVTGPDGTGEQMRRGLAGGVGRALDNLANYYIRLAEQTFPVVEIDSARTVDVALTKGVRIIGNAAGSPAGDELDSGFDEGAPQ